MAFHFQKAPEIVQLGPQQEAQVARFLAELDLASRVSRFGCVASDAQLLEHQRRAFVATAWLAGVFVEQRLRGIVELYDFGSSGFVEATFLVETASRRRGLGTALLQAARRWAAENDRIVMRMVFSTGNWPMRKLAGRAGARLDLSFGEMIADLSVKLAGRDAAARLCHS